jgi:peroxiredoxin
MPIKEGEMIPAVGLVEMVEGAPTPVQSTELGAGRKIVIFAVPGAFTPTCSAKHVPGFLKNTAALRAKGVEEIVCVSVNDAFVMNAWGEAQGVGSDIRMVADGNGDLASALGLEMDGSKFGMGTRSQRFAMILQDNRVEKLLVESGPGLSASSAESVLEHLAG